MSSSSNTKKRKSTQTLIKPSSKSPIPVPTQHQFDQEIPDFPRGGGSRLSRDEREEVEAEVDAEFDNHRSKNKKSKASKSGVRKSNDDELGSLFGEGVTGKLPRFANKITLKNISPGMKLWGVITEVSDKDLAVTLPGGLRGLVRASEAVETALLNKDKMDVDSHFLSTLFHVGQLVSCIVLQVEDDKKESAKRKVWLSLRLALLHKGYTLDALQEGMVMSAYVKSIEDHGYILDFGTPSFTGFVPKKNDQDASDSKMIAGQLVQGVVKNVDKTRKVVYLTSDSSLVSKCVTKDLKGFSLDLLVPGMMVNARIQATLENGIMLSFLTYFTGTADIFHLQNELHSSDWKKKYDKNMKVNARILFVDPSTRAVGLTMNPHLILNKAPPVLVKTGDIYDKAKITRIDRQWGLLLAVPSTDSTGDATPAYVTISDVADDEIPNLEKKFKEGSIVRARILSFRHMEGIAMSVLKASAFEGAVFTHADVKPGMVVKAKVIDVKSVGATVQFPSGVKALCPLQHMSELDVQKPRKKFKVGAVLDFRVLGCKSKRITVTHKKTLVKSKLGILSSYADATEHFVTHGWITKIEIDRCIVQFYNGVKGIVPRSELGLEPGCDPSSRYHVGQVVKCRVTSSVRAAHHINLSFIISQPKISEADMVKLGSIVSAVVEFVMPNAILLHVNVKGNMKGTIFTEHLADHQGQATQLKSVLKPGHVFSELLVLDIEGNNLILSAKYSLIHAIPKLPVDVTQISLNSVVHGYVCNLIETGCFVRFLGRLTGFSPKKKALDDQSVDISEAFYVGQSVRSNIVDIHRETGRISLSLKQSSCSSTDISFLQSYFLIESKIAELQVSDLNTELGWLQAFGIGSIVEGTINEVKDVGVVVSFDKYSDVFGFITQYQLGGKRLEIGSTVQAVVLDIAKSERLIDLSLKSDFVQKSERVSSVTPKKKRKRDVKEFKVHERVSAVIEIVKEDYLVVSLPEYNFAIGYTAVSDYNTQKLQQKRFSAGETIVVNIMALPSDSSGNRLLLQLESSSLFSSSKKAKKTAGCNVGSLVQAEISDIKTLEIQVKFGSGLRGRIHISETNDGNVVEEPFRSYKVGETLTAKIVGKYSISERTKNASLWELSLKSSLISGSEVDDDFSFSIGQYVSGYVVKVDKEWVWLAISRQVKARLYILDSACEPDDLKQFQKRFKVGSALSGYVLTTDKERKTLRLITRQFSAGSNSFVGGFADEAKQSSDTSDEKGVAHFNDGDAVGGRVWKILPGVGGILVQLGPRLYGKAHYTELADSWVSDPLAGYVEGKFVKCKVLKISHSVQGSVQIDLSLRSLLESSPGESPVNRFDKIEELQPDMVVKGYVKSVTPKGCFILLSRNIDAKILLSNLSDGYIKDPVKEFPVGKLVSGKILSVEPLSKRVEVTLKVGSNSNLKSELSNLNVGDVIKGRVKRVESFGLFVVIDNTRLTGLCHVSEISDDHIDNLEDKFKAGDKVVAKILKLDAERQRISLGMKSSDLMDVDNAVSTSSITSDEESIDCDSVTQVNIGEPPQLGFKLQAENELSLAQVESRASVPPLEVSLDDVMDGGDERFDSKESQAVGVPDEKNKRRAKKKEKEQRELEITAAEQRLLEKDAPKTTDEFEKVVRRSPNNSFLWIKYMQFMLSMADVEGARSVAERALKTINITYETEKLNVWVAYLNLENQYGDPHEEAVNNLFQRALQYCDPLKLHLELLGLYERTEQHKLADELLGKMVKKFKQSYEVWLRQIQWLIKQKNPDGVDNMTKRALLSLPHHEHIKFLSQTAIIEFKDGVPDRGRSTFEKMLREYSKRTDLWSVYLDQEIRLGDVDLIRGLFERATSLSLPPKKMNFLFKKYLNYEKSLGDEERIDHVRQKAKEYADTSAP